MHILFLHNDYGRFSGEEEAVERIAGLLASHGHRISWLRKSSGEIGNSLAAKAHAFAAGIWSPASRREMIRLLENDRPDVVQVQNLYPFLSSSVLSPCRERGVPVVMRCPNYRLFCPTGLHLRDGMVCEKCLGPGREWNCIRYNCEGSLPKSAGYAARNSFNRLTGTISENVDRFIVLSEFQKAQFQACGIPAAKISVVPNIAPVDQVEASPVPIDGEVVFVGRIDESKGIREFIEAARQLPGVSFAVAGETRDALDCVGTAPPNVRFAGFLSGKNLDAFVAASRIVVCPSKWFEGFPNVIAQAMAHGRPVVGSRIGAIPEIVIEAETGMLCAPGDSGQLADVIDRLFVDAEACCKFGRAGRAKADREYGASTVLAAYVAVYGAVSRAD